ncbi:energy transducer TonB family protein [Lichenibacterium dinghuense]|uniref:energy transducer TonB family protein n=1 Tax=Lichenibacterium dinghuense TaxID=2895977 RepID=UPI001F1D1CDA|nr:energy transducer TonB [Lichenibacterium sp. 6Y81]
MTRLPAGQPGENGSAALRWIAAAALALGLHAGVALLLVREARPEPLDAGGGDAVAVELDPVEGEVAKPDEVPPAVPADEARDATAAAAAAQASRAAQQPLAEVPQPTPVPPEIRPPEPPPSEVVPDAPAPLLPPEPPRPEPRPEPQKPATPPVRAAQSSSASPSSAAADEAAPTVRRLSAARVATWRGKLVPHLNRFRRPLAGTEGGTARVGFTIDEDGRVTSVSLAASSGDAALDAAAEAMIRRASPFPPPPPGLGGAALSFVVPVHYDARRP